MLQDQRNLIPTPNDYMFIPRTLSFIFNKQSILLIKRAPTKQLWPDKYNAIGGHVNPNETIDQAALREIFEETKLAPIHNFRLHGLITIDTGTTPGIILFVFSGESKTRTVQPSTEGTLEWIPLQSISHLPCVEDLPNLISQVFTAKPANLPFYTQYHLSQD